MEEHSQPLYREIIVTRTSHFIMEIIFGRCWYYESEGIMGSHVTFIPKISKLDVHLE